MATAVTVAAVVAVFVTLLDWVINPDDLFHGDLGTDWGMVWETWSGWFLPMALVFLSIGAAVAWWRSHRR